MTQSTKEELNFVSKKYPNILFLIGLPDDKTLMVSGYNKKGELAYDWRGNADFHNYINIDPSYKKYMLIIWHKEPERKINKPDIVVNCISDCDISGKSLEIIRKVTNQIRKKWPDVKIFNNPDNISKTTRENIYNKFKDLDNIYIPKVIRITPKSAKNVLELVKKAGVNLPFLIRKCGSHQNETLQLIRNYEEAEQKLQQYPFDGSCYYVTEFIDNLGADGFYHKARLVIINGKIYPRHYMTSNHWMVGATVHYNYMPNNDYAKNLEKEFLDDFTKFIPQKSINDLLKIYDEIGLNFLGYDIDIMADGKLLIFEINVAQNAFLPIDMKNFAYMQNSRDKIISALNNAIL